MELEEKEKEDYRREKIREREETKKRLVFDWMQRLSRSLIRFETQDIKTQPLFNHHLIETQNERFQRENH